MTDLKVIDASKRNKIVLNANFFQTIGLNVALIEIVNAFIENVDAKAFNGLNDLFAVNLTNSGLTILHPVQMRNNF